MRVTINEKREFSASAVQLIAPSIATCKEKLGITTFGYRRFLPDGRSFGFSDNKSLDEIFLKQFVGVNIPEYERDLKHFIVSGEKHSLRKGKPDPSSHFFNTLYEVNVWNTLSLYEKNNNYVEAFFFSATRDETNMTEIYMNKLNFIHDSIKVFRTQLNACFTKKTDPYFATTVIDPTCLRSLQNFLCEENSENLMNVWMSLSEGEWEIANLLAKGYKRRHIASLLDIAPKTVDSYIEHIKEKTKMPSKNQFLKFLSGRTAQEVLKKYEARRISD